MSTLESIRPIIKRTLKKVREGAYHPSEATEQMAVVEWARMYRHGAEQLHMMPNGSCFRRDDFRLWTWLMSMGFEPGQPDLYLDIPRGKYHGLRIEMKPVDYKEPAIDPRIVKFRQLGSTAKYIAEALGKKPSTIYAQLHILCQQECQQRLRDQGYRVEVCKGSHAAISVITEYLRATSEEP